MKDFLCNLISKFKIRYLLYIITFIMIIICIAKCTTPIVYNCAYHQKYEPSSYYYSSEKTTYTFQKNDICKRKNGSTTTSVYLYFINSKDKTTTIYLGNSYSYGDFEVIDRTTLKRSDGTIWKSYNGGETVLIIFTVLFSVFSTATVIYNLAKLRKSKANETNNTCKQNKD